MKKIIITSFLILFLSLIFLQVGVLPKYTEYRQLRSQLGGDQQMLAAKKEYYSRLFTTKHQLDSYQSSSAKASSALPPYADAADLYRFATEKASESGLVVQTMGGLSMNPGGKEGKGVIEFRISVEGAYSALTNFLKAVEDSSRLINVKLVRLVSGEEKEEAGIQPLSAPLYSLTLETNYASAF